LANLMVTRVRQRLVREREQRRRRKIDPAWAHRTLLLRGYDTLSARARTRLDAVLASAYPTDELSAAWGVKEQLRRLLNTSTIEQARYEKMILGCYMPAADLDETWRLWATIEAWWPAVEVLITSRVTNARTEAAKTGIKHINAPGGDTETQPTTKPVSCSPAPLDARREPIDQAGHHGQMRIADKAADSTRVRPTRSASSRTAIDPASGTTPDPFAVTDSPPSPRRMLHPESAFQPENLEPSQVQFSLTGKGTFAFPHAISHDQS
jgi:hypothetical protein